MLEPVQSRSATGLARNKKNLLAPQKYNRLAIKKDNKPNDFATESFPSYERRWVPCPRLGVGMDFVGAWPLRAVAMAPVKSASDVH